MRSATAETIETRQLHIEHHDLRMEAPHSIKRRVAIDRLAEHLKALGLQQFARTGSEPVVVIHDQHGSRHPPIVARGWTRDVGAVPERASGRTPLWWRRAPLSVALMPQRPTTIIACLAATLATVGCGGAQNDSKSGGKPTTQPTVLRLANFNTEPGTLQLFADEVARASHGTLKITFVNAPHAAAPDGEQEIIRDVQHGRAPLGATGARAWDSAGVDDFQALVAPFLIGSYGQQQQVLQSAVAKRMLASLGRVKLTGVALLPGPMRRMLGVEKSYLAVSDFAGTRIGMNRSKVAAATMRALGATPVAQTIPAKLTGLDGLETYLEAIAGNGFGQSSRSATVNIAWWPRPVVIFANPHALTTLSTTQRQALLRAGLRVLPAVTAATVASDRDSAAQLCRSGFKLISATPIALRSLRGAVQPVYASLDGNPVTRGYIEPDPLDGRREHHARGLACAGHTAAPPAARNGRNAARRRLSHVDHCRRGRQVRPRVTVATRRPRTTASSSL